MKREVQKFWNFVRELTTDDAYEIYLARHRATHPEAPALSRRDFYIAEQQRKWSGIQRCC